MRHLSHWKGFLSESEESEPRSGPTMIPFIFLITSYYKSLKEPKMTSYWVMGSSPSFQEMVVHVLDAANMNIDLETESQKVSNMNGLSEFINSQTYAEREIIMWSDGLELVDPKKESHSVASAKDPFWLTNRLENYFVNSEQIIGKDERNSGLIEYLAKSLENRPNFVSDYTQEQLDQIIPLTNWDEKQKKAYLGLSKSKGLI